MNNVEYMAAMLRYKRPAWSKTERKFIQRFITQIGGLEHDAYGNRFKRIGNAPIMYSCHTDSVHTMPGLQEITAKNGVFKLHPKENSNCLGADNAAGVWIMREMMKAEKPGLYVFHRAEEIGRKGSLWLAKRRPEMFKDIKAAIAFDRRNTKSIITFQIGGRCCSNDFADSLSKELRLNHFKDEGGTFTDTASYTDIIGECTNVSAGFMSEHTKSEMLDMNYLSELRAAMLEMNWENLVFKRNPGEKEERKTYYYTGKHWGSEPSEAWAEYYDSRYGDSYSVYKNGSWRDSEYYKNHHKNKHSKWSRPNKDELVYRPDEEQPIGFLPAPEKVKDDKERQGSLLPDGHELDECEKPRGANWRKQVNHTYMVQMVKANPALIATLLEDYGVDMDTVADFLFEYGGILPSALYGR